MSGVLINVGSSSSNPNGRGRIFKNFAFEYLPIPESCKTREKVSTYRELSFTHVKFPDLPVHLDPEFQTFTYGHVKRGFGDLNALLKLQKDDVLFFYATLQKERGWSTYVIGYFRDLKIYDCRTLSTNEIQGLRSKGFSNNAHLKRVDPSVDILVRGGKCSKLLKKAFPLAEDNNLLMLRKPLENITHTATGKKIQAGTPWFRWTMVCPKSDQLLSKIDAFIT